MTRLSSHTLNVIWILSENWFGFFKPYFDKIITTHVTIVSCCPASKCTIKEPDKYIKGIIILHLIVYFYFSVLPHL